jgi:hypothetical protein
MPLGCFRRRAAFRILRKLIGVGSQYAAAFVDADKKPLDGSKTYKLHLPPNIPAKDFWSIVVYDNQTRSMLQTDQRLPAVGSQKAAVANPDTSVDVYFGPTAPAGHEANWVQTIPGKGWNVLLRLYGPLQPWYDKTWRIRHTQLDCPQFSVELNGIKYKSIDAMRLYNR